MPASEADVRQYLVLIVMVVLSQRLVAIIGCRDT